MDNGPPQAAEKRTFVNADGLHDKLRIELTVAGNTVSGDFTREPLDAGNAANNSSLSESADFSGTTKGGRTFNVRFKDDSVPYNKPDGETEWKLVSRPEGTLLLVPYMARLQDGSGNYLEVTLEFTEVKPGR